MSTRVMQKHIRHVGKIKTNLGVYVKELQTTKLNNAFPVYFSINMLLGNVLF